MWEEQLHALVLSLPEDKGVALLAADAPAVNRFIVDSGSGYNLGPHRTPTADADAAGATSELRAPPPIQHTHTAGGGTVTLDEQYSSQVLVRDESGQLVLIQWAAHNVPGLGTKTRSLHILSTDNIVIANQGEMVSKPPCKGGSYLRVMATDPQHPDEAAFLTGRIPLTYTWLGAAELTVAVRQPGEHHLLAVLRPSRSPAERAAAPAVRSALQDEYVEPPVASILSRLMLPTPTMLAATSSSTSAPPYAGTSSELPNTRCPSSTAPSRRTPGHKPCSFTT
jgi:hypothetical protein